MSGDLAAFLAARLDEDEAAAKASLAGSGPWALPHRHRDEDVRHIARHDPARVLREVAAKRAILADYEEAAQSPYNLPEGVSEGRDDDERERDEYLIDVLGNVVCCLAAVYSDHPDYDPGWAPVK